MSETLFGAVRIAHIVTGVAMAGGTLLWAFVVAPSVTRRLPPAVAGAVMRAVLPRLTVYMNGMATLAILTGLGLLALLVGARNIPAVMAGSVYGMLLLGGLLALLGSFVVGNLGIERTVKQLMPLLDLQPPPAKAEVLARRLAMFSLLDVGLVLGILMAMATAVNLRT